MRRFDLLTLALFLFALPLLVLGQDSSSITTYTTTRTVYRVYTETSTGTPPATVYNTTSTITQVSVGTIAPTGGYTTGTGYTSPSLSGTASASASQFTGAAAPRFNKDAALAAVGAVGLGLLAL